MSELAPVAPRERLVSLDVLRGFALLGVLIGNMGLYNGAWAAWSARGGPPPSPQTIDQIAGWFEEIFVSSKAQTTLTLLFGFGFAAQLLRAERRGEPVMGLYVRRLLALFVLGAAHVSALWWGDVCWGYSIAGFGLLAFQRASNRTRVICAIAFIFVPFIVWMLPGVIPATTSIFFDPANFRAYTAEMLDALQRPDRSGLAGEHIFYALIWSARIWIWYPLWTLGRFLLGYVAGQLRWFDRDGADHLPVFRRMALWCGGVAVATTAVTILEMAEVFEPYKLGVIGRIAGAVSREIGLLALAFTYIAIVMLLIQRPVWRRLLGLVAPAGRMPLTTYFSQSLICTYICYGWGLGRAESVRGAAGIALALTIFSCQVALCHLWLRYFQFGPLEWLWRTAVYGKVPPMRLAPAVR